jgi:DNA-binding MarR family transcriptional regulator
MTGRQYPPPYDPQSDTSRLAWLTRHPDVLSDHRRRALRALDRAGADGLTDFQLAQATGVGQTSIGKRRLELERLGLVERVMDPATGRPATRPTPSGATAGVYRTVGAESDGAA